jgi:RNA polymerase sigma-70 factor (ECF subfamily)
VESVRKKGKDLWEQDLTDNEIIAQMLQGQRESFSLLVKRYQQQAFKLSLVILHNRADAEDAVSEAFVKAFAALPKCREKTDFKSWFLKITYNCCQDILRKRKKISNQTAYHDLAQGASQENPLQDVVEQEEKREVWAALNSLNLEDRTALVMKYYQNASYQEIADTLKWTPGTVASRLYRAREKLRHMLERGEVNG